jgi:hypothetical protein
VTDLTLPERIRRLGLCAVMFGADHRAHQERAIADAVGNVMLKALELDRALAEWAKVVGTDTPAGLSAQTLRLLKNTRANA